MNETAGFSFLVDIMWAQSCSRQVGRLQLVPKFTICLQIVEERDPSAEELAGILAEMQESCRMSLPMGWGRPASLSPPSKQAKAGFAQKSWSEEDSLSK